MKEKLRENGKNSFETDTHTGIEFLFNISYTIILNSLFSRCEKVDDMDDSYYPSPVYSDGDVVNEEGKNVKRTNTKETFKCSDRRYVSTIISLINSYVMDVFFAIIISLPV